MKKFGDFTVFEEYDHDYDMVMYKVYDRGVFHVQYPCMADAVKYAQKFDKLRKEDAKQWKKK